MSIIGIIDTDGDFKDEFFSDKKILKLNKDIRFKNVLQNNCKFSHSESVISAVLWENPNATIYLANVINKEVTNKNWEIYVAFEELLDLDVNIICLSLGLEKSEDRYFEYLCSKAKKKGIIVVAAHSNSKIYTIPANLQIVLGVTKGKCRAERFFTYNKTNNDILLSSEYTSQYHLKNGGIISGNSFLLGSIVGIISNYKNEISEDGLSNILQKLQNSKGNKKFDFKINDKDIIYFYDRDKTDYEIRIIKEKYVNAEFLEMSNIKYFSEQYRNSSKEYHIFIDHSYSVQNYSEWKKKLFSIVTPYNNIKSIVFRYPAMNFFEREDFFKKTGIILQQIIL